MTTESQAVALMEEANPVPDLDSYSATPIDVAAFLTTFEKTSNEVRETKQLVVERDTKPTRRWFAAAAVAATALILGVLYLLQPQETQEIVDNEPAPPVVSTTAPSVTTALSVTTHVVEAFDYGFRNLPTDVAVGTILELVNTSTTEFHNMIVVRLDPSDDRTVDELADLPFESWYRGSPGDASHNFSDDMCMPVAETECVAAQGLHARPGQRSYDGRRIRLNTPGRYLILGLIPKGADPQAVERGLETHSPPPGVAGGLLGYQNGMIAILNVLPND